MIAFVLSAAFCVTAMAVAVGLRHIPERWLPRKVHPARGCAFFISLVVTVYVVAFFLDFFGGLP